MNAFHPFNLLSAVKLVVLFILVEVSCRFGRQGEVLPMLENRCPTVAVLQEVPSTRCRILATQGSGDSKFLRNLMHDFYGRYMLHSIAYRDEYLDPTRTLYARSPEAAHDVRVHEDAVLSRTAVTAKSSASA
jgi:hypothetical protein